MKKTLLTFALLLSATTLGACSTEWSWWNNSDISIEKYISREDAMSALDTSSQQYKLPTKTELTSHSQTFFKEYLGKFSTETDSDYDTTTSSNSVKYENNVVVSNAVNNQREEYLNAKSVATIRVDSYLFKKDANAFVNRTITDYGYGDKVCKDIEIPSATEESDKEVTALGSRLSASGINWDKATYGFSKKDEVIIETMNTTSSSYTVKFNGNTMPIVINEYNLYKLTFVEKVENKTHWMMDYSYSKMEVLIGSDIFKEPLKEPFLLEKSETTTKYSRDAVGSYDTSRIPEIK